MITLYLRPNTSLNTSLQVGDAVYVKRTIIQTGAKDAEGFGNVSGIDLIGYLTDIDTEFEVIISGVATGIIVIELKIDDTSVAPVPPLNGDEFVMFSKYSQLGGEVLGYYASTKLVNNSKIKAEIFSLGSEVIINSK